VDTLADNLRVACFQETHQPQRSFIIRLWPYLGRKSPDRLHVVRDDDRPALGNERKQIFAPVKIRDQQLDGYSQ
jgi:hypothetical protein